MKTSERRNAKRMRKLRQLKAYEPRRYEAEKARLVRAWCAEAWRRACKPDLPPAGELIAIAERFGLDADVAPEVIRAIRAELGGPGFLSHSVARPKKGTQ